MNLNNTDNPYVVEVKLCHLSIYRHDKSNLLLKSRDKRSMGDDLGHKLPLVEPQPFTKRSWRRENSLPIFYERPGNASYSFHHSFALSELTQKASSLLKSFETDRSNVSLRDEDVVKKASAHPRAEFPHRRIQPWRTQDLIPSFIGRSERTRTTLLQKRNVEDEKHEFASSSANDAHQQGGHRMRVMGGRLHHGIQKRHLVNLNPLDGYGYPDSRPLVTSLSEPGTLKRRLENSESPRAATSIREATFVESPQKFHWKIGAAKNALDIMNKVGTPTRVERKLQDDLIMNLERLRRDNSLFHSYLINPAQHYVASDRKCTPGERLLNIAWEANSSRKGKHRNDFLRANKPFVKPYEDKEGSGLLDNTLVAISKCPTERSKLNETKIRQKFKSNSECVTKESTRSTRFQDELKTSRGQDFNNEIITKISLTSSDKVEENFKDFNDDVSESPGPTQIDNVSDKAQTENSTSDLMEANNAISTNKSQKSAVLLKGRSHSADELVRKTESRLDSNDSMGASQEYQTNNYDDSGSQGDAGSGLTQKTLTTAEYLNTIMGKVELPVQEIPGSSAESNSDHTESDVLAVKHSSETFNVAVLC